MLPAAALFLVVTCTGYNPSKAPIEFKIFADEKNVYSATLVQTIAAENPNEAPKILSDHFSEISYMGGLHYYYYENSKPDFKLTMDDFPPENTPNSSLSGLFQSTVMLHCCSENSGVFPLSKCLESAQ